MLGAFEQGRGDSPEMLATTLAGAPLPYLEGALSNPALRPELLLILFKNPRIVPRLLQRIASERQWMKSYDVRSAIVMHPKTPRVVAMNLVSHLWWRDLAKVIDRAVLAPPLRRTAERILAIRVQEMALGERISLARIASRGVINSLRGDQSPMVIRALLQNPRLVEEDALAIASRRRTTGAILQALVDDPRFAPRPAMRKAIARHPATPVQSALRMIRGLGTRDLRELAASPQVPGVVRLAVHRILEGVPARGPRKRGLRESAGRARRSSGSY
jgi:hypothetical protein